jgi:hypothetical protein
MFCTLLPSPKSSSACAFLVTDSARRLGILLRYVYVRLISLLATQGVAAPVPSVPDPYSDFNTIPSSSGEDGKASYGTGAPDIDSDPRPNPTFPGAPAPSEPYGALRRGDPSIKKRGIATYASGWNDKYDYFTKMSNLHWYYDWYEQQPSDRIRDWTNKNGMEFVAQFVSPF